MGTKTARQAGGKGNSAKDRGEISRADVPEKKMAPSSKAGRKPKGTAAALGGTDPAYLALIRRLPLRPIPTEAELDVAAGVVDELTDRDDLSPAESDYLEVLGDLVEKYEDEHVKMPQVSDGTMLRSFMDEKGVRQADVAPGHGHQQDRPVARPERQAKSDPGAPRGPIEVLRCEPVLVP